MSLRDLEADPFVLYDGPHSRDYFLALFRQLGLTPRVRHRASGYETVRSFVSRGHGYSILNQRLHHDLTYSGGSVVPLRIVEDLPPIKVVLLFPSLGTPTRRAQAFAAVCRQLYGVDL